jgi:RNA polymerase sigma-70 factor (ECF subfamily)
VGSLLGIIFSQETSSIGEGASREEVIPSKEPTPVQELEKQETGILVQKALNMLPLTYKTAIILCDVEKYSYERIAEILECPIGTVRSRIHQGRALLRKAFEKIQFGIETAEA